MSNPDKCLSTVFQEVSAENVRNVCVIAHVDHGKTTLADFLVSANGIISARLAGKLRYMDSREDEQSRGITMKSSAITLLYPQQAPPLSTSTNNNTNSLMNAPPPTAGNGPLLLNLIDSPGHVDFSTEVSSAVNLADIAILLVDAVEGVCSQTESLIRQALVRKLDLILVVNKLDRLVVELKMSEPEAHRHLQRLIEFVNACLSKTIQGQLLEQDWDWHTFEQIETKLHFDPANGNVLFASALHGYAFGLEDFGHLWAKRLTARRTWEPEKGENKGGRQQHGNIREEIGHLKAKLVQHLFSRDHYFSSKTSEICAGAEQKGKKTMFEQFVLEPLWEIHKCALVDKDIQRLLHLASKLALPPLRGKRVDEAFSELMRIWLPLSATVVRACAHCRSAQKAYQFEDGRLRQLFITDSPPITSTAELVTNTIPPLPSTATSIRECNPHDPLMIAFVAKSFKATDQQQCQRRVSLCRVMSGTLKIGHQLSVLKAPSSSDNTATSKFPEPAIGTAATTSGKNWRPISVSSLFIVLGRELIPIEKVQCGRICGIEVNDGEEWIGGSLLSSRPLSTEEIPRFDASQEKKFAEPIVRVIIKPANPDQAEHAELRRALRQLAILDSAVRILEPKENEIVLLTAGQVHLQKCLEDLNALGQTELIVSEPIVPFLETVVPDPRIPHAKILTQQLTECQIGSLKIRLRAVPLSGIEPDTHKLLELLEKNAHLIDSLREGILNGQYQSQIDSFRMELTKCACEFLPQLKGSWWAKKPRPEIQRLFSTNILAFGPANAKFNIFFNNNALPFADNEIHSIWQSNLRSLEQAIVGGFHSAMVHGPLCDEPMQAIGIVLEDWKWSTEVDDDGQNGEGGRGRGEEDGKNTEEHSFDGENGEKSSAQLHGQLISAIKQTCRASLKKHTGALRLLVAMYECRVQTPEQALGKVQAVLAQKRAKVHSEEVNELNGLFEIGAQLPVIESFSFCEQLRKRSSGTASAQLEFAGWQLLDEDPFWEPSTEEEMEEFGRRDGANNMQNQARQYMDAVRRRKGLPTEDIIVIFAEKQRNLKRNK